MYRPWVESYLKRYAAYLTSQKGGRSPPLRSPHRHARTQHGTQGGRCWSACDQPPALRSRPPSTYIYISRARPSAGLRVERVSGIRPGRATLTEPQSAPAAPTCPIRCKPAAQPCSCPKLVPCLRACLLALAVWEGSVAHRPRASRRTPDPLSWTK